MINKFLPAASLMLLTSSCAYHTGMVSGGSGVITNNQFSNIEFAYGSSRTVNFLGIGGNQKDALILEAKRNLYLNSRLKPSQVIGQTTVDYKRTLFFPFFVTKVTLSAEIIDFSDTRIDTAQVQRQRKAFTNAQAAGQDRYYDIGQQVYYLYRRSDTIPAKILDYQANRYLVKYFNNHNHIKIKRVPPEVILPIHQVPQKTVIVTPIDPSNPEKLYTPRNPQGQLIRFTHEGQVYTGELINKSGSTYFIRMTKGNGDSTGFYIDKEDIIE